MGLWLPAALLAGVLFHPTAAFISDNSSSTDMLVSMVMPLTSACPDANGDLGVRASAASFAGCNVDFDSRIRMLRIERPVPRAGEALVRIDWSSVNPCNWKMAATCDSPMIAGSDFVGVVEDAVAPCPFRAGDVVWGNSMATFREYGNAPCSGMGLAPSRLKRQRAAVLPVVALTGLMGYEMVGGLPWTNKPRVLVLGGSSGTGSAGIQLAKAFGAGEIITTCGTNNTEACRRFGADRVIDYHREKWWKVLPPQSVDIVYDCVCLHGTGNRAYNILKENGVFLTIQHQSRADEAVAATRPSIRNINYLLSGEYSDKNHLDVIRRLADEGKLSVPIDSTFDLTNVAQAFQSSMRGHTVGKISIRVRRP